MKSHSSFSMGARVITLDKRQGRVKGWGYHAFMEGIIPCCRREAIENNGFALVRIENPHTKKHSMEWIGVGDLFIPEVKKGKSK